MTPRDFVADIFRRWEDGDSDPFFEALAPEVIWTAKGTTPISGTFHGKQNYLEKVYQPLLAVSTGPTKCQVRQIVSEGDTVVVEWHGETPTRSGTYSQDYCWIIQVNSEAKAIVEVTGYFDTAVVDSLLSRQPVAGEKRAESGS